MAKIPDDISLRDLCNQAAQALSRAGLNHRIDIYRDVEVDDPAVRMMLGRSHKVRVRVKITATSLLFENSEQPVSDQSIGEDAVEIVNGANGAATVRQP
jgi:hypothetical protein